MPSTRPSSTKSGASKRAPSKRCARAKSKDTSTTTSDQVPAAELAGDDEARSTIAAEASPQLPALIVPADVVNQVVEWALLGHSGFNLTAAAEHKFPDLPVPQIMAAVAAHFAAAGQADPVHIRGFAIEGYRELYRKALTIGDLPTALKALARLEKAGAG